MGFLDKAKEDLSNKLLEEWFDSRDPEEIIEDEIAKIEREKEVKEERERLLIEKYLINDIRRFINRFIGALSILLLVGVVYVIGFVIRQIIKLFL